LDLEIAQHPLSYVPRLEGRHIGQVNLVVIHCTELPDLESARQWGEKIVHPESRTGNCGHYYIDRDGSVAEWVPVTSVAHHVKGFNPRSIGIELVNRGRYPDWFHSGHQRMTENYPVAQVEALTGLLNQLVSSLPGLKFIAGHEDLDKGEVPCDDQPEILIRRKLDPGPCFPWSEIMDNTSLRRVTDKDL
jgi:N-acetylmuramoyl-L-alanine amidase